MSDDEHEESAKRSKRWVIAVMVPVLYVLGIGPVVWGFAFLADRLPPAAAGRLEATGEFVFPIVYGPLIWMGDQMPWLGRLLEWYVGWLA